MGLFDFLSPNRRNRTTKTETHRSEKLIYGYIGYYNLEDWWLEEFSEKERNHILNNFNPLGDTSITLVEGQVLERNQSVVKFLSTLVGWFKKSDDWSIGERFIKKAEERLEECKRVLDLHFFYQSKAEHYYRGREHAPFLQKAIDACEKQIALSPRAIIAFEEEYKEMTAVMVARSIPESELKEFTLPAHHGYRQLAIIWEKENKFEMVISICAKAMAQGWQGDWEKRIERCRKKME